MFYKNFQQYAGSDGHFYYCTSHKMAEHFFSKKPENFNATWQGSIPVYRRSDSELFASRGNGGTQLKPVARGVYVAWNDPEYGY